MFDFNVKNFRSFKDQNFSFSRVNILIGENSSGKSSLIKFFLALKQTLGQAHISEKNFAFSGEHADLGNFREAIYYNQEDLRMSFSFKLTGYTPFFFRYVRQVTVGSVRRVQQKIGRATEFPMEISFSINKELTKHNTIQCSIRNEGLGGITIEFPDQESTKNIFTETSRPCTITFHDYSTKQSYFLSDIRYEKAGFLTLIQSTTLESSILRALSLVGPAIDLEGDNQEAYDSMFIRIAYLLMTQNFLQRNIENMVYINPLISAPARIYYARDAKELHQINDIEDFVHYFSKDDETTQNLLKEFVTFLKEFGILDDLEILTDEKLPVRELRVKIKEHFSNITDVGYGVALQLPIILKCFLAEKIEALHGSIILIEQPEIHLHPRLHAKLIEIIIQLSKHTTYLIESHSEHLVRKLQVAVKQNQDGLDTNSVSIHYLKREHDSIVTAHVIQSDGKLIPSFSSGFFDNSYQLSRALLD